MFRILTTLVLTLITSSTFATSLLKSDQSYAEEYRNLRLLLEKVQDTDSALHYKAAIEKEIQTLNQSQVAGRKQFHLLSNDEKKLFIKRFQQNRFHCGEVTQVMVEKRRILFKPSLSKILAETLANIP